MVDMKVAIDVGPLKTGDSIRGIGVYTRELVAALELLQTVGKSNFEIYPVDYFNNQQLTINNYNIIHLTRFNPFRISVPFKKPAGNKFVLTIYDLIPLIYPSHYPPGIKGKINWFINKCLIRKNIDAIITISETSKKDICRFTGVNPEKIFVTHLAPRPIFRKLNTTLLYSNVVKYHLPKKFALYVGDVNYNKNIPNLVKACKLVDIPLVIVGKQASELNKMDLSHPELAHLKNTDWDNVVRVGFVPDSDLVKIYNLATVFVQPSFYEGFGLPLLEAQASGVPVVASKTQALVEIAEGSALFFDPKDSKDMAEKIKMVTEDVDLKNRLIQKGIKNAAGYFWDKTAQKTLEVYRLFKV